MTQKSNHLNLAMSPSDFAALERGDLVRNVGDPHAVLIDVNHGNGRFTAVRTVELTNPAEWILVKKSTS